MLSDLENLALIKNEIKEKFGLSKCSLFENENLQLVLKDNISNEEMEKIAEYCKIKLEEYTKTKFYYQRCCCSSKRLYNQDSTYIYIYFKDNRGADL